MYTFQYIDLCRGHVKITYCVDATLAANRHQNEPFLKLECTVKFYFSSEISQRAVEVVPYLLPIAIWGMNKGLVILLS